MKDGNETGLKACVFAALALAFASFGDAFLYPFLPLNSGIVGVPVVWVGVLLSINRFVRIISNSLIVIVFAKLGLRTVMMAAAVLAIASTFGYGVAGSLIAWLTFRVMWGLSFSAMRIGTLGYALQREQPGFALGLSKGVQEAGPMVSLLMAPVVLQYLAPRSIFYALGVLSLPALYFAWKLPAREKRAPASGTHRLLRWPSTLNSITFLSALVIDGIIVIVLGILFLRYREDLTLLNATALAAFYLGYRRVCLVALSPAGGWLADKVGLDRLFNLSLVAVVVGLVVVASGWIGAGAVIVFTFYSINTAVTPGAASKGRRQALHAVAENATWRDVGAAAGTLTGGVLLTSPHLTGFLILAIFLLTLLVFIHLGTARKAIKILYVWK